MSDAIAPPLAAADHTIGLLVHHTTRPDWGLGKILHVDGDHVHVYFKDAPGDATEAVRVLARQSSHLARAEQQHDLLLDHLPSLAAGRFPSRYQRRVTVSQAVACFVDEFDSFESPRFLREHRDYTARTHAVIAEWFTGDQGREWLGSGEPDAIAHRLRELLRLTNLLSRQELTGLDDALADTEHAVRFGDAVLAFVASPAENTFTRLADATAGLPVVSERARVLTWPVVTALPYLATPRDCMFLKPDLARRVADALCVDLLYDARPRWATYQRFVRVSTHLLHQLRPLGARDFIDVQAFMTTVGSAPLLKAKRAQA